MLRALSFDILKSFSMYPLLVESRFSGALVLKLPLQNLCHENTDYFESRIFSSFYINPNLRSVFVKFCEF